MRGHPGDFGQDGFAWWAMRDADNRSPSPQAKDLQALERTPLIAVCHLIVKLGEAGKL